MTSGDERDAIPRTRTLAPGARLGRYFVLGRLGAGAYGEVYRGYDPQLDRRVALKLLRPERTLAGTRRAALLREAKALAKLSHPAVVAVFEVVDTDSGMVLAMELVEGVDLAGWIAGAPRWTEALGVVLQAGRGLVAAHAAGVVHRDFKPANVLIGSDGRARVVDFGLALVGLAGDDEHADVAGATDVTGSTSTQRGAGTPLYMAPELFAGAPASAATDQYAFFATLYEAIYRVQPHRGTSESELVANKVRSALVFPQRPAIPAWLRRALRVGLAPAPSERYPDLAAAIAVLERGRQRRRSRVAVAIGAVALGVAAWGLSPYVSRWRSCAAGVGLADASWDASKRELVRSAMSSAAPMLGDESWPVVDRELSGYLDEWRTEYGRSCAASDADAHAFDPALRCLRQQQFVVDAWVDALASADATAVERAVPAIVALPRPRSCGTVASREGFAPVADPEIAVRVEAVRRAIGETATQAAAGDADGALARAEQLVADAQALAVAPLEAETLHLRGWLRTQVGDPRGAVADLESSVFLAERVGHDAVLVRAATELTRTVGVVLEQPAQARIWARHADAMLHRGAPDPALEIELLARQAEVDALDRRFDASERALGEAIALATRVHGPDHLVLADLWIDRGGVAIARGADADAEAPLSRGLQIRRAWLPAHHPAVASAMHNLAALAQSLGHFADAQAEFLAVAEIERDAWGDRHPKLAITLTNLGSAELGLEAYADAEAHTREALAILRDTVGADHPNVGAVLVNLGQIRFAKGDDAGALADTQAGIAQLERVRSPTHTVLVQPLLNLAMIHRERGEMADARAATERARAIDLDGEQDDATLWAWYVTRLAALDACAGETARAIAGYESALAAMRMELEPDDPDLGATEVALARAWRDLGADDVAESWALAVTRRVVPASGDAALVVALAHALAADRARTRGHGDEALAHERGVLTALGSEDTADPDPASARVTARLALARALWHAGRHAEARAELEPAIDGCASVGSAACTDALAWSAQRPEGLMLPCSR